MTLEGEWASANASLMAQAEKFEADMRAAVAELEQKHAYRERVGSRRCRVLCEVILSDWDVS